jgi:hypothetical protein
LKREWNKKGLYWYNDIFGCGDYEEFKAQILEHMEKYWLHSRWNSWNNFYSCENAKSYLWTPSIIENYKVYQCKRRVEASINKDLNYYPYEFCLWLERLCSSIFKLLVERGDIDHEDLLLIGLNINACGKSGLAFHKDIIKNYGYGDVVVNLILSGGGFVVLSESKASNDQKYGVWLGAGDCYVISNSSRFDYFHIVTTTASKCKNVARDREGVLKVEFKPDELRMSLTLRYFYNRERKPKEMFDVDLK